MKNGIVHIIISLEESVRKETSPSTTMLRGREFLNCDVRLFDRGSSLFILFSVAPTAHPIVSLAASHLNDCLSSAEQNLQPIPEVPPRNSDPFLSGNHLHLSAMGVLPSCPYPSSQSGNGQFRLKQNSTTMRMTANSLPYLELSENGQLSAVSE
jgi:hypothetical protein